MKRVLVLVHFKAKREGGTLSSFGLKVWPIVRTHIDQHEPVFSSNIAFGFVGVTNKECSQLHKDLSVALGLVRGDDLTVMELTENIISTHPGLLEWRGATQGIAALAGLARRK